MQRPGQIRGLVLSVRERRSEEVCLTQTALAEHGTLQIR
jgi:hypothetical protein